MTTIRFDNNEIHTAGELPAVGSTAPLFNLVDGALSDTTLDSFSGKNKVLNIVPSLDTGVCAASARRFNSEASTLNDTVIINISADLPFAQKRFCESEGLNNITTLSTFRSPEFGKAYGVLIIDGPLAGLMSRAVVILDKENKVAYTEQVGEIKNEPDYNAALKALKTII